MISREKKEIALLDVNRSEKKGEGGSQIKLLVFIQSMPDLPQDRLVPFLLLPVLVKSEPDSMQPLLRLLSRVPHNISGRDRILDKPDSGAAVQKMGYVSQRDRWEKRGKRWTENLRPAHLPGVITSVGRGLELGLVIIQ